MVLNIVFIVCIEILAISCVCAGFIFGRYSRKIEFPKHTKDDNDEVLDPISPAEQEMIRQLELEGAKYEKED